MSTMRFRAVMKMHGRNPYVLVSAARAATLKRNWRKPLPVLVRINGKPERSWSINMMPIGDGTFRLYLHGNVRTASNTRVGDQVKVELRFDAAYHSGPSHPMPSWFRAALTKNPLARKNWEALIPSRKKEILRYFSWLRSREAYRRNLARALQVLSGKSGRFMARSWSGGR
jgi:hypothetical protein